MVKLFVILGTLVTLTTSFGSVSHAAPKKYPSPCKIRYPSDDKVEWECRRLGKGSPESIFNEQWQDLLRFNRIDRRHLYPGFPLKVPGNLEEIRDFSPLPPSYPTAEAEPRFILIDL